MKQKLLKCLGKAIPMLVFSMLLCTVAFAQKNIAGKVVGPDGNPISGATVSVKGTVVATVTSLEGTYSIVMPAKSEVLIFSSVGYELSEVSIDKNSNTIDVAM